MALVDLVFLVILMALVALVTLVALVALMSLVALMALVAFMPKARSIRLTILPIQLIQSIMLCCSFHTLCSNHFMWPFMDNYVASVTVIYLHL